MSPGRARLVLVVVVVVLWEAAARGWSDPSFLSPPSLVLATLGKLLASPGVASALVTTFWELAVAFALSVAIGFVSGLALGLNAALYRNAMPIVFLLYATPQVVILPLFILYFGIGPASKIAFGVSHGMFPIIVSVAAGAQNIKPIYRLSAVSMGASRAQVLRWVVFPGVVPGFFTGMRLGMSAVLLGVLLAELYVSARGIGYFTHRYAENFQPAYLLGLIVILAAMAILLNEAVRRAERSFERWRSA